MSSPMVSSLRTMMLRELRALEREIAAYPDDSSLWEVRDGIPNSAGNLALHLAGNLRHFIGAVLGGTGYQRDRDLEFSAKGLSRSELTSIVQAAIDELSTAFDRIDDDQLDSEYPIAVQDQKLSTLQFLTHLAVHLSYHLGQIDYHRRLLTNSSQSVGTVSPRELTPFGRQ
jgi:uncharacterized damage-inducible protein DinB